MLHLALNVLYRFDLEYLHHLLHLLVLSLQSARLQLKLDHPLLVNQMFRLQALIACTVVDYVYC